MGKMSKSKLKVLQVISKADPCKNHLIALNGFLSQLFHTSTFLNFFSPTPLGIKILLAHIMLQSTDPTNIPPPVMTIKGSLTDRREGQVSLFLM